MMKEASEALYAKTVRDIDNNNHELEKRYRKECNKIANINRDREKEVLRVKLEAKDHNAAEVDRCKGLFEEKTRDLTELNKRIYAKLNSDLLKQIEETKRDNIFTIDMARERYNRYYKRDIEHNHNVSLVMFQITEIREQMVSCRRFLNVLKKHFADLVKRAKLPYQDPEESAINTVNLVRLSERLRESD
jgi:predicted lactoylglutathione lyase